MPIAVPRYTVDHLAAFPDDGNRYELLDGELLVTPAPLPPHEFVVERLHRLLVGSLEARAHVFTRGVVQQPPRHHLEPDLLVVPRLGSVPRRWSDLRHYWLAVEVSARGSRIYDRDFKHPAYRALGARDVWVADLSDRSVVTLGPDSSHVRIERGRFDWQPPDGGSALSIDVGALFQGIDTD